MRPNYNYLFLLFPGNFKISEHLHGRNQICVFATTDKEQLIKMIKV